MIMFLFYSFFGKVSGTIMVAIATGTNISCSLGSLYGPVLGLVFIDVYGII